jgi:cytochrome c556
MHLPGKMITGALAIAALAAAAGDTLQPTARNAEERTFVLDQMRLFVDTLQIVTEKLAAGDNAGAAEAAAQRGRQAAAVMWKPAHIASRETAGWKQMMGETRGGFDAIAAAAAAGAPLPQTLARMNETLKGCVACHQTYRLVDASD